MVATSTEDRDLLSFPPFRLDLIEERLWREDEEVRLRRKPFAILRHLVRHPRALVTQEEIVEAVWGKVAMSESLLRTHVRDLRQALGEGFIETVTGRGYRFIAEVQDVADTSRAGSRAGSSPGSVARSSVVGRTPELEGLGSALQRARESQRQLVFVTGEAGVGKTTLIESFLTWAGSTGNVWVSRGACVEQYGAGEAYLPVFDALAGLCRSRGGEHVVEVLSRFAPTWLTQMPAFITSDRADELQRRVAGATQARMLRELGEALDALSAERPVLLALDDLQWSDQSTIQLLAMLARRRDPARLMLIGSYRNNELAKDHPLAKVLGELVAHKQASELALEPFSATAVDEYISHRFPGHGFPPELASTLLRGTCGNPLFVVTLFDDLCDRQMIREVGGSWQLAASVESVAARRPDSIRRLIDIQIDRLEATDQRILEVASVVGNTFTAELVARVLEAPLEGIDSRCESLADEYRFFRYVGIETWPDGTIQSRYEFVHAIFQDAAHARNPSSSVRQWHRTIAERLEAGHPNEAETLAAELAVHFDEGQDYAKAAHYLAVAGEREARRNGTHEAVAHFRRARSLVARLPEGRERDELELRILHGLGPALFVVEGLLAQDLTQTFRRAADLSTQLGKDEQLCDALIGLQHCRMLKGELRAVGEHTDEVIRASSRMADASYRALATFLSASADMFRGRLREAEAGLMQVTSIVEGRAEILLKPHVTARCNLALVAWLRGLPDQALAYGFSAIEEAEVFGDPFTLANTISSVAITAMLRGEPMRALEYGRRAHAIASDARLEMWLSRARSHIHWASSELEQESAPSHVAELLRLPWDAAATGRTLYALELVRVCMRSGRESDALEAIDGALSFAERTDERIAEAELHRLRGELLKATDEDGAARCFAKAIEVAKEQSAKAFELRAWMSQARCLTGTRQRGALDEVRRLAASFTEGAGTADLVEAAALLQGTPRASR
jgi:DNA-binding winged helix-turn-helix (wHTH) protein/tetratricopeptide (TPR) repeat protein